MLFVSNNNIDMSEYVLFFRIAIIDLILPIHPVFLIFLLDFVNHWHFSQKLV